MSQRALGADLLEVGAMRSVEELLVVLLSAVSMPNRSRITLDLFGCPTFSLMPPELLLALVDVEAEVGKVALAAATATKVFESWFSGRCCALLPRVSLVFELNSKWSFFMGEGIDLKSVTYDSSQ